MKRDAPASEIDLGAISRSEEDMGESPTERALRESLTDQHYEAMKMREWFEHELQRLIGARRVPEWPTIQSFADWRAREHLLRTKLSDMGWPP